MADQMKLSYAYRNIFEKALEPERTHQQRGSYIIEDEVLRRILRAEKPQEDKD